MVAAHAPDPLPAAVRLAKYLAHAGVASRRAAETLIGAGRVTVDGALVTDPARDVGDENAVALDGRPLAGPEPRAIYALHKPVGVLSTARDTHGRKTVLDLIPARGLRLYPVGRLDADSSGLILLTNDGQLAHELTHPSFEVPKTYRAKLAAPITDKALRALRAGVQLEDGPTAPARAARVAHNTIELAIHEGRNRQVRRMCKAVGFPVQELTRVSFGPLQLGTLAPGAHRQLSVREVEQLRAGAL